MQMNLFNYDIKSQNYYKHYYYKMKNHKIYYSSIDSFYDMKYKMKRWCIDRDFI